MHSEAYRILVADRDPDFRRTVQLALKMHFRHVGVADSGPQILAQCERTNFALVIVGDHLPGMLGIEVVRRLEKDYPHMVRILTSEHDTDPVIESALAYGLIDRFLKKPLDVRHLVWEAEYLLGLGGEPPHAAEDDGSDDIEADDEDDDAAESVRAVMSVQTLLPLASAK